MLIHLHKVLHLAVIATLGVLSLTACHQENRKATHSPVKTSPPVTTVTPAPVTEPTPSPVVTQPVTETVTPAPTPVVETPVVNSSPTSVSQDDPNEPTEFKGMIAAHNAVRQQVGVQPLRWSTEAAQVAQAWADTLKMRGCPLEHNPNRGFYGENAAWGGGMSLTPQSVVGMWAAEGQNYRYSTNTCTGNTCGHYTQVVWGTTTEVGCGKASCGNAEVWICNYAPPGNYMGQKPY